MAYRHDGSVLAVPAEDATVVDTVGAGDGFAAGLLAWLDRHERLRGDRLGRLGDDELTGALRAGRRVAAATCRRAGAALPYGHDL